MSTFDFDDQMRAGDQGESFLDAFFEKRGHTVRHATRDEQRQGIDRVLTAPGGEVWRVEYKTDYRAADTGNAFIETVSVDSADKMGWALTAQSDYLIYYLPEKTIYVLPMKSLHWALPRWIRDFPQRTAQNNGYATHGVLVPLAEVAGLAVQTFAVGNGSE